MFTDTHCHLFKEDYDDIKQIIDNAKNNKVGRFFNNGYNDITNKEVVFLVEKYKEMYGLIGIHPSDCIDSNDYEYIEKHIHDEKVIGIGEIGLDYHYDNADKKIQKECFEKQLKLAEKYNLPVIIHSRDATKDTIDILKKYKVRGIIHSFSGSLETANIYIKMGFLLGVNGIVTFKNCKLKDTLKNISLDNIVLETDSPYLTPVPFRGKQNEPKNILEIAKFLTNIYNITIDELIAISNSNIKSIFDI